MTEENKPNKPQILQINRKKVYQGLAIAGVLSLLAYCTNAELGRIAEAEANEPIDALFYQNTAQCEADANKQQAEYIALQKQYKDGQLTGEPNPPAMKIADCAPQMLAAQHEHNKTAPVYSKISPTTTGRVTAPRHISFTAPSRPTGTSASGTIRGRSSQGFGSSFKSTGFGGK